MVQARLRRLPGRALPPASSRSAEATLAQGRRGREGGRKAAPRAAPGRAAPGARRGCRGGGAGRSAAPRAAAGSQGREGPAAGDFMGRRRRRREVGLAFPLPVPSAGRARGGRCAGQRGRGTAVTESGS